VDPTVSPSWVHFIPIVTTAVAIPFAIEVYRRWDAHRDRLHLLWWAIGIGTYAVGTFTEGATTLLGWREPIFRAWYISGALLGGAPLAQGTVYLMLSRHVAHALTAVLMAYVAIASLAILTSPIDYSLVETYRLSGRVLGWQWVRWFSPVVNLYAVVFLIGGAILSALKYSADAAMRHRMWANVLIALGAILPGIGGTATRMGHVEVLYVTELVGLLLTWTGYRMSIRPVRAQLPPTASHQTPQVARG
jgi:hypothetical protein